MRCVVFLSRCDIMGRNRWGLSKWRCSKSRGVNFEEHWASIEPLPDFDSPVLGYSREDREYWSLGFMEGANEVWQRVKSEVLGDYVLGD